MEAKDMNYETDVYYRNDTEDEALARSKYRYKDCVNFSWHLHPEYGVYYGQGDLRKSERCKVGALKKLTIYTPEYAAFACPRYCPYYEQIK